MKASKPTLSTAELTGQVSLKVAGHVTVDFLGGRTDEDRGERQGARGDQEGP
ncbi:hypothetical protein PF010_g29844 [Phytophthora fragariae]|uniref:Uncharacterized protein n=1 Tax=Phytophthora fragariae TaxID=53985 RepID=A0A6A3GI47_9STRA|nr:hypothetical protein PF003_g22985 [Phytophthora fragariae]KAE8937002.1 hypothetical protein PF009_g13078 [Phytophthora fragariae]KAE8956117.1 hypothetical protein PF011_g31583 [Phytophthora fragariae]KAE9055327.1 hypothetical protein PF007_g32355 [Phytophthora fragariae]KAE9061364.1 hypothetical protein PF010_g29844 [Phytophthora fragariae]